MGLCGDVCWIVLVFVFGFESGDLVLVDLY